MVSGNGRRRYAVEFQPRAAAQVDGLRDLAIGRRVAKSFTEDVRSVVDALEADPVGWGDSLNDYKTIDMVRRRGRSTFLYVYYSFNTELGTSYVHGVQVNPYGPLG